MTLISWILCVTARLNQFLAEFDMEILGDCEGDLLQPNLPAALPTINQPTTHDQARRTTKAHDQREDGTKDDDEQDDDDTLLIHSQ